MVKSLNQKQPLIIVGMSGGVDSSVAACLLLEQGYQVAGLFMKNWEETDDTAYCTAQQDLEDAAQVCATLEIPLHQVNFAREYWDQVFQYFLAEYRAGRTPNPDIMCNKTIKFSAFLNYARKLGADYIATGHYARVQQQAGQYRLYKGLDSNKDQSYFLHRLDQAALRYSLFPLGDLTKPRVRELATEYGFDNHRKKDSTGICFIGERRFRDFLANYLPAKPGVIQTLEGEVIGEHLGAYYYTIGQRQGLGIGGVKGEAEAAWYVVDKDVQRNILTVVQGAEHRALFKQSLRASQLHGIAESPRDWPKQCAAKIRYRQTDQECELEWLEDDQLQVNFTEPQRAVTPGQAVVFYQNDQCLGGGVIAW